MSYSGEFGPFAIATLFLIDRALRPKSHRIAATASGRFATQFSDDFFAKYFGATYHHFPDH